MVRNRESGVSRMPLAAWIATILAVLAALTSTRLHSFLLFHTLAEFFSVAVAYAIFMVFWNTRRFFSDAFFPLLSIAYLFVGLLDLLHAITYRGMGVFPGTGTDLPTQLWVAARALQAGSILAATALIGRRAHPGALLLGYSLLTGLILASIFVWGSFPACHIEGVGLTPFKRTAEYVICGVLVASVALLVRRRDRFERDVYGLFIGSLIISIASELAFTLYTDVYGPFNLAGHLLKIVAFYLMYRAFIVAGLTRPYGLLFRDLKVREDELAQLNETLEKRVAERAAELARSNEALRESERRFRAIFNGAFQFTGLLSPDGTLLEVNDTALTFGGIAREDAVGRPFWQARWWSLSMETQDRLREAIARAAAGEFVRYEVDVAGAGGSVVTIDFSLKPVLDESGRVSLLIPEGRDITERIQAEHERERLLQKAESSEARFRSLVECAPDSIIIVDTDGTIVFANARAEGLLGFVRGDLLGQSIDGLVPDRLRQLHPDRREEFRRNPRTRVMGAGLELTCRRADGTERPVEIMLSPLDTPEGPRVICMVRDVTERKRMEQALRQSERLAAIGQVMTGLSHESRNALQRAIAALRVLERRMADDADNRAIVGIALEAQENLRQVYESVREYAAPINLAKAVVPLDRVWRSTWEELAEPRRDRDAWLVEEVEGVDLKCCVDVFRLQQVFRNLMENSLQACADPVEIRIACREGYVDGRPALSVTISDNGPGITSDQVERIFEPFYTTKTKGTGLGMAIVKRIVESHGGRIDVNPATRSGFEVTLVLPRTTA